MKNFNKIVKKIFKRLCISFNYYIIYFGLFNKNKRWNKLNLCSGPVYIDGYCNTDIFLEADVYLDLEKKLLPFRTNSLETVVCISSINYFSRERGEKIIKDVYRALRPGGVARFATQDLRMIAKKYLDDDKEFFFQKLPDGRERFEGETIGDKFNSWFYGYAVAKGKGCKYFYDYETLALLFKNAGFTKIQNKKYMESVISEIKYIDNRPEQMFFLEAIK